MLEKYHQEISQEIHNAQLILGWSASICIILGTALVIWISKNRLFPILGGLVALLVAAILIPSIVSVRPYTQRLLCINGLLQIREGKAKWAAEHGKNKGDIPSDTDLFGPVAYIKHKPNCPLGGIITIGPIGQDPTCSFAEKKHRL